jgi:uncharacterized protein YaaR (DUF327 family)
MKLSTTLKKSIKKEGKYLFTAKAVNNLKSFKECIYLADTRKA